MVLSTAERNRRKRERKKREKESQKNLNPIASELNIQPEEESVNVEIEYVPEPLQLPEVGDEFESIRIIQERSAAVITDDERQGLDSNNTSGEGNHDDEYNEDDDDNNNSCISKRKLREMLRPSIADLKQKVNRPDLVEAHDITASDPEFLIYLKSVQGTVPVPRHWGRKRKYLQGKRGFEKPPFQLPDFIVKTGITEIRDTVASEEESMSIRQKNRQRVAPKMGAIDVDYGTLHAAFFKYQTKPKDMTKFGDLYYEGKELEAKTANLKPGKTLSRALRDALGMTTPTTPPPWLINMQRYGPPPSWVGIPIPGLNAPLPSAECQYGFHPGGWGKPPIDGYGRPLYGGNPFDPPGSSYKHDTMEPVNLVTSDGKTVSKSNWGALPSIHVEDGEEQELSEDDDMEGSSSEEEEADQDDVIEVEDDGIESVLPPPPTASAVAPANLRKDAAGDETPLVPGPPKQLYQVIEQRKMSVDPGAIFASEMGYVLPGAIQSAQPVPEGAESVLTKILPNQQSSKSKRKDDDDDDDLGKNFKF